MGMTKAPTACCLPLRPEDSAKTTLKKCVGTATMDGGWPIIGCDRVHPRLRQGLWNEAHVKVKAGQPRFEPAQPASRMIA